MRMVSMVRWSSVSKSVDFQLNLFSSGRISRVLTGKVNQWDFR